MVSTPFMVENPSYVLVFIGMSWTGCGLNSSHGICTPFEFYETINCGSRERVVVISYIVHQLRNSRVTSVRSIYVAVWTSLICATTVRYGLGIAQHRPTWSRHRYRWVGATRTMGYRISSNDVWWREHHMRFNVRPRPIYGIVSLYWGHPRQPSTEHKRVDRIFFIIIMQVK